MNTVSYGSEAGVPKVERERTEGKVAKAIETRTSKLPSDLFLWAAGGSIVASALFELMTFGGPMRRVGGRVMLTRRIGHLSLFVGQWAPTFLLLGVYNKIVKVLGSEGCPT